MRRISAGAILGAVLILLAYGVSRPADFAGGSGTEEEPYLVETPRHLDNVRNHPQAHFRQIADIDLKDYGSEYGWRPIADFEGVFDGSGYEIVNLKSRSEGLYSVLKPTWSPYGAKVKNVVLKGVDISGRRNVGAIASENYGTIIDSSVSGEVSGSDGTGGLVGLNKGRIENSYSSAQVTSNGVSVGGVAGKNRGSISGCRASGKVKGGSNRAGGLVGYNLRKIAGSHAWGDVKGSGKVGGLVGRNESGIFEGISDSYASGDVEGKNRVGGLVGVHRSGSISGSFAEGDVSGGYTVGGLIGKSRAHTIVDCYAVGRVDSTGNQVGGLVGWFSMGNILRSYAAGRVTGRGEDVGGLIGEYWGGTKVVYSFYDKNTTGKQDTQRGSLPKTTELMMRRETFENWVFDDVWAIDEGQSYPYLQWEKGEVK